MEKKKKKRKACCFKYHVAVVNTMLNTMMLETIQKFQKKHKNSSTYEKFLRKTRKYFVFCFTILKRKLILVSYKQIVVKDI